MQSILTLKKQAGQLPMPERYFSGQLLPEQVALPDNILIFYHRWPAVHAQVHPRHVLVIPFEHLTYYVDNQQIDVSPGQAVLIRPYQNRDVPHQESSCERLLITFEVPHPQPYLPDSPVSQLSEHSSPLLGQMIDAYLAQDVVTCSITLAQVLMEIANRPIDVPLKKLSLAVADTLRWISDPSTSGLGIKTIAQKLEMSPSNLRRVFRREMGVSLGRYIRNHRMGMAKHQLRSTNLSIGQIAAHCDYSSIYAFSHAFKDVVGQSPQQYRRQHIEPDTDAATGGTHQRRASDT